MADNSDVVIKELQNAIGALYTQLASLKAEAQAIIDNKDKELQALKQELEKFKNLHKVPHLENPDFNYVEDYKRWQDKNESLHPQSPEQD